VVIAERGFGGKPVAMRAGASTLQHQRENLKYEYRNSKQISISKFQMFETAEKSF
jgi:hypothetical protein